MNLPFFIARRYLLSKRKKNFINIISLLSLVSVAFITAALIIVLSVFNGLGDLLRSLNNAFDPQIKIVAGEGKSFPVDDLLLNQVRETEGVQNVIQVIEDYAYVRYRDANQVVVIKGVSNEFIDEHRIDPYVDEGSVVLKKNNANYALIGKGVQITLSVALDDDLHALQVYYIKSGKSSGTLDPSSLYVQKSIRPAGVFSIIQNLDENYVIVPLSFAQDLLSYGNRRTSLEVTLADGADMLGVQRRLKDTLGEGYRVLNSEEQHKDLYKLVKMEKLFTFLAFTLLLGVGGINIFFSLMMLALDKKKDISVLSAIGADQVFVRNIFLFEGAFISVGGAFVGLLMGGVLCYLQQQYGLVSLGMESSVASGYPVKMATSDFAGTLLVVVVITFLISVRPALLAARSPNVQDL